MTPTPDSVIALRLDVAIAKALGQSAARSGREPNEQIVWWIIEALDKEGLLPEDLRAWLLLREAVISRFGSKAAEIIRTEGWRSDIIAETARRLMTEDAAWAADYAKLIAAEPYAKGVKVKDRINPLLGKRVKGLLGAVTGKAFSVPQPSIFTTASHLLLPDDDAA
ncbi:hypothetical protein ACFOD4_04625 [Pseudoroseomonas globiformis]|uniref:Uncharacterized protein n=1 Tax=Teichococcus globiformis TaxID=2307229 RepID=A0ABV7FVC9_9PROT